MFSAFAFFFEGKKAELEAGGDPSLCAAVAAHEDPQWATLLLETTLRLREGGASLERSYVAGGAGSPPPRRLSFDDALHSCACEQARASTTRTSTLASRGTGA